jgi:hypothetical protein
MSVAAVVEIELEPIAIDPRPCGLCGRTIDQHDCFDQGEGPEFFCYPDDDLVKQWELADPRDRWKHTGEPAPPENVRNADIFGKPLQIAVARSPYHIRTVIGRLGAMRCVLF